MTWTGSASSRPWSQVNPRHSCWAAPAAVAVSAGRRRSAVHPLGAGTAAPSGGGARPGRTALGRRPTTRSPSQCPGTARSAAAGGRWLIWRVSRSWPRPWASRMAVESASPDRWVGSAGVAAQRTWALDQQRQRDGLVPPPHHRIGRSASGHQPPSCSGDQPRANLASTTARSPGSRTSLAAGPLGPPKRPSVGSLGPVATTAAGSSQLPRHR